MKLPRFERNGLMPAKWFFLGVIEEGPYDACGGQEYYVAQLRLPFWQWGWLPYTADYGWTQAALFFHGKRGFEVRWIGALPQ